MLPLRLSLVLGSIEPRAPKMNWRKSQDGHRAIPTQRTSQDGLRVHLAPSLNGGGCCGRSCWESCLPPSLSVSAWASSESNNCCARIKVLIISITASVQRKTRTRKAAPDPRAEPRTTRLPLHHRLRKVASRPVHHPVVHRFSQVSPRAPTVPKSCLAMARPLPIETDTAVNGRMTPRTRSSMTHSQTRGLLLFRNPGTTTTACLV